MSGPRITDLVCDYETKVEAALSSSVGVRLDIPFFDETLFEVSYERELARATLFEDEGTNPVCDPCASPDADCPEADAGRTTEVDAGTDPEPDPDPTSPCPATRPSNGADCDEAEDVACEYGAFRCQCNSPGGFGASGWTCFEPDPPEPDTCSLNPTTGDPCSGYEGQTCGGCECPADSVTPTWNCGGGFGGG